jgi:GntR family transcriptional regulator / MocR family aminotransferase
MSSYRRNHATAPPQLVLGFGNLTDRSIKAGISAVADLLQVRTP